MEKYNKKLIKNVYNRLVVTDKVIHTSSNEIKKIYWKAKQKIKFEIEKLYNKIWRESGIDTNKLKELVPMTKVKKEIKSLTEDEIKLLELGNYTHRIDMLQEKLISINTSLNDIRKKEQLISENGYKKIIRNTYNDTINSTLGIVGIKTKSFNIDEEVINEMLSEPFYGHRFSERLWEHTGRLAKKLKEELGSAILAGEPIAKINQILTKEFNVATYQSDRILRTEAMRFYNLADLKANIELGLEEYVYIATLDTRTSNICQGLDHKRFKYKDAKLGINFPPMHPNCRSTTRAYIDEEHEKSIKRHYRDKVNNNTNITYENYSYTEWIGEKEHKVFEVTEWIAKGKIHKLDGKHVVIDHDIEERMTAKELSKYFKSDVGLVPRVMNQGTENLNIRTPDFIIDGETWDMKAINGDSNRTIDNAIKGAKGQTNNIILKINNIYWDNEKTDEAIKRIRANREWVKDILVIFKDKSIKRYKK